MMSQENLTQLTLKLNELKKIFSYGEKLIPVIQSLGDFMKDTMPLLQNINRSIAESTSKFPKATNQIQSITNATEMATTEILDVVDSLNENLIVIEKTMIEILVNEKDKEEFLLNLVPAIQKEKSEDLIKNFLSKNSSSEKLGNLLMQIGTMKENANSIAISLQVQDITSQQLAAVNHLIESVQEKLSALIADFDSNEIKVDDEISVPDNSTFDPNARYSSNKIQQAEVDSIFNNNQNPTSQAEIDKLFG